MNEYKLNKKYKDRKLIDKILFYGVAIGFILIIYSIVITNKPLILIFGIITLLMRMVEIHNEIKLERLKKDINKIRGSKK